MRSCQAFLHFRANLSLQLLTEFFSRGCDLMNEIANALKVMNTAVKTVKVIDVVRKATISAAVAACCVIAVRFIRK